MAVYQISRIQHRRGTSGELPDALADGEIGMTTDTGEVFIGAAGHPSVSGRKSYPYQNIKLITELDVQRTITGDVYYHGALVGQTISSGQNASVVPLFAHGTRDFANYDVSISSTDRSKKVMFTITVCVHPSNPTSSSVQITPGSVCYMNWDSTNHAINTNVNGQVILTNLDDQGQDSGVTWLKLNNNFGLDVIVSVAGREWSNAQTTITIPTVG